MSSFPAQLSVGFLSMTVLVAPFAGIFCESDCVSKQSSVSSLTSATPDDGVAAPILLLELRQQPLRSHHLLRYSVLCLHHHQPGRRYGRR